MTDLRDEAEAEGEAGKRSEKKSICEIKTLSNVLKHEFADKKCVV
jgi:hypothetical protein